MAKKKRVKKTSAVKKGGAADTITKLATGDMAPKRTAKKKGKRPETPEKPGRQRIQQDLIPDAFPERNDRLEELASAWVRISDQKKKAAEKIKAINDQVAVVLIEEDLTEYKCYTVRKALFRNMDAIRVRTVPEKEATPYQPA